MHPPVRARHLGHRGLPTERVRDVPTSIHTHMCIHEHISPLCLMTLAYVAEGPRQGKARKTNTFLSQLARKVCFHLLVFTLFTSNLQKTVFSFTFLSFLTFGGLCASGLPRPAKGSTLGFQSWSKGTPFDWTSQIKQKLSKPIHFIVNLPASCVFIYIFAIFDLESPESCVFINIFYIFDIWRS